MEAYVPDEILRPDAPTHSDTYVTKPDVSRRRPVLITLDGRRVSERFVLQRLESTVGRDVRADIIVADGEVSRRHCIIIWKNHDDTSAPVPDCEIRDLGSTNGTHLNGNQVKVPTTLKDGDQIRVGKTVLGFFLKDERVLELDQLLLSMALHDSLTGVYKREYFFSELHREFDRSRRHVRPLSLLMVDIDHFKLVNDECGHLAGDEALKQVADLIRLSLREGDICGRFGGEEFAVVLPETNVEGARLAAERIREAVEGHEFRLGRGITRRITASAGVATLQPHHADKLQLLDAADMALYEAKEAGRNLVRIAAPGLGDNSATVKKLRLPGKAPSP